MATVETETNTLSYVGMTGNNIKTGYYKILNLSKINATKTKPNCQSIYGNLKKRKSSTPSRWKSCANLTPANDGPTDVPSGDHSPPTPDPPWSRPPPAPTAMTDVSKSMSRDQQLAATQAAIEDIDPTDIQVYTDGSTHEGTTDGGAGMVAMSGEDIIERWHAPTGRWSSSYRAEKSAMVRAISWLYEYEDWQSALVLCDSKSLVETLANSNQPNGDVHRIQSAIAELCKKKEVRILWVPGHCNIRGNELADLEANLGSEVAKPSVPLDSSTRAALIRREEMQ